METNKSRKIRQRRNLFVEINKPGCGYCPGGGNLFTSSINRRIRDRFSWLFPCRHERGTVKRAWQVKLDSITKVCHPKNKADTIKQNASFLPWLY